MTHHHDRRVTRQSLGRLRGNVRRTIGEFQRGLELMQLMPPGYVTRTIEGTGLGTIRNVECDIDGTRLAARGHCTGVVGHAVSDQAISRQDVARRPACRPARLPSRRAITRGCGRIDVQHDLVTLSRHAVIEFSAQRGFGQ